MYFAVCIEGINLEKLLTEAAAEGIFLRCISRSDTGRIHAHVSWRWMKKLEALCGRFGWVICKRQPDRWLRAVYFAAQRYMLILAMMLSVAAVWFSSRMILAVSVDNAQEHAAEIRRFLEEEHIRPGKMKAAYSTDSLRDRLTLRLPGLAFAALRYEGSTLIVNVYPAREGEKTDTEGKGMDVVAAQDGVITRIFALSGTPQVQEGDTVRKGQVLILGQERTQKGEMRPVRAQGRVMARVWARGEAKARLYETKTEETGAVRKRITLHSPWHTHVVQNADPFSSQDVSVQIEPVIGLYLPLYRKIETYAQTVVTRMARNRGDAASAAQGAAMEIAKKQCPFNALILDKSVHYSMIDNEFLYAVVTLEYETSIAARLK